jgi:hypothetical protein
VRECRETLVALGKAAVATEIIHRHLEALKMPKERSLGEPIRYWIGATVVMIGGIPAPHHFIGVDRVKRMTDQLNLSV